MEILSCSTKEQNKFFSPQDQFMGEEVNHYFDLRRKYLCVSRPEHWIGDKDKRLTEKNRKSWEEGQKCKMGRRRTELVTKLCQVFQG